MTAVCLIGRGRVARALLRVDPDCLLVSARDPGFAAKVATATQTGAIGLLTARDPKATADENLALSISITAELLTAGVPPDRLFHAGSYTVDNPIDKSYRREKRLLEDTVLQARLSGRVIRLPIVLIGDDRQRRIVAQLAGAIEQGLVERQLRIAAISPARLRDRLNRVPANPKPVEILGAELVEIASLIKEWQVAPIRELDLSLLSPFILYSDQIRANPASRTHYERQVEKARIW